MKKENSNQSKKLVNFRKIIPFLYFATMFIMVIIVCINIIFKDTKESDIGLNSFSAMDSDWFTAKREPFEIQQIDKLQTADSQYISIYHPLPKTMEKDESIVFRSKNCSVKVSIEGTTIYETDTVNAPFYNHSPGTRWNVISISSKDAGKEIELYVEQAYEDGRAKVDNFYFGDRAAIILNIIYQKLLGSVISLMILFVGLLFFCAWIVLNGRSDSKDNSLLWLAIFAIVAANWCLLETNLFQFFSQNLRLIQVIDNMMLLLAGMPLYLYLDSLYDVFKYRIVRILCGLNASYIILATLSQIFGLWDFHQTLNGAIVTYAIVIIILIICLIKQRENLKVYPSKGDHFFNSLQQGGIIFLGVGLLGDLVRYLFTDVLDRAFIIRIGLLCFIICFGAGNIYNMIQLVQKGSESDFIHQLAYSDGLTKAGNRTAYQEHLQSLKSSYAANSLGLVMFDINDLKKVNDTFGHKSGDALILCCAEIIQNAFSAPWSVYRIGGDEFIALIHGTDVQTAYTKAVAKFTSHIYQVNEMKRLEYPVIIAHGAAFCESITDETITSIEKDADKKMYLDKEQLKAKKL